MRLLVAAAVLTGLVSAYLLYPSRVPEPLRAAVPAHKSVPNAKPAPSLAAPAVMPALRLVGLLGQVNGAEALIELDGAQARAFHVRDPVAPGWVLEEIGADSVVLGHGADRMRLALTERTAAPVNADSGLRHAPEDALGPKLPSRPVPVPDEVARERNRRFLQAVRGRNSGS